MLVTKYASRILTVAAALLAHGLTLVQFRLAFPVLQLPHVWQGQFTFLLSISMVLALLLPLMQERWLVWTLLITRAGLLLLLTYPIHSHLAIEATLLTTLIIEANVYTSVRGGALFSLALTVLALMMQQESLAWRILLPAPTFLESFTFGAYALFVAAVSALFISQWNRLRHSSELSRRLDESLLPLAQANMKLQEYAITAGQEAVVSERKRVAREMHDTTAYSLTNLIMMLEAAIDLAPAGSGSLLWHLERTRDQAKTGLIEVRRAVQALRMPEITDLMGLEAIQRLVEAFEKATQIQVILSVFDGVPANYGEETDLTIFRLVQEGLTNALRHGRATRVMVSFARIGQAVSIQIKDNGVGSSGIKEGYGLTGMRERIAHLGGQMQIYSEQGIGFLLSICIPLEEGLMVGEDQIVAR